MAGPESPIAAVLIVDDEAATVEMFDFALRSSHITNTIRCQDSREVLPRLEQGGVGVVLLDLTMPHMSGQEVLEQITRSHPEVPVIVVTGINDVNTAVECMKMGAFDYMVKPVEDGRLVTGVLRAMEMRDLREENALLRERLLSDEVQHEETFAGIITQSQGMRALFRYIEAVARSTQPVLIIGETGVGKELFARAVHAASGREGQFVPVNVAGVDENLFSDALFGHVKGAFTGADDTRPGLVERAAGGTLFLDEVGDLGPVSQVKLLRLLQEREYMPLGSETPKRSDARVVAATNRDLDARRQSGELRADLYYRLQTHQVSIPPLRERLEDLPLLLDHFLEKASEALGKGKPTPPPELNHLLAAYDFPGNVRELEAMVFDAVSSHRSRMLSMDSFKERIERAVPRESQQKEPVLYQFKSFRDFPTLRQATDFLIAEAMHLAGNKQSIAAQLLGISRPALNRRLKNAAENSSQSPGEPL